MNDIVITRYDRLGGVGYVELEPRALVHVIPFQEDVVPYDNIARVHRVKKLLQRPTFEITMNDGSKLKVAVKDADAFEADLRERMLS